MRKNRKMPKKLSVVTVHFMHLGAVLVTLFAMVILNMLANSRCAQLENSIGAKNKTLRKLDEELQRQDVRWRELQSSENLEQALVRHGLSMHYPNASQTIRMRRDGSPYPGQLSVAKAEARARSGATATASVSTPTRRRSSSRWR